MLRVEKDLSFFKTMLSDWTGILNPSEGKFVNHLNMRSYLEALGNRRGQAWHGSSILGIPVSYSVYKKQHSDMVTYAVWSDVVDTDIHLVIEELSRALFLPSGMAVLVGTPTRVHLLKVIEDRCVEVTSVAVCDLLDNLIRVTTGEDILLNRDLYHRVWLMSSHSILSSFKDEIHSRGVIRQVTDGLNVFELEVVRHAMHNTLFNPALGYLTVFRTGRLADEGMDYIRFSGDVVGSVCKKANLTSNTSVAVKMREVFHREITPSYVEGYTKNQLEIYGGRLDKRIVTLSSR